MSDVDGLRAAVVQTLGMVGEDCDPPLTWRDKDFIQAAVLPVVTAWAERVARQRAVEELRAAAKDVVTAKYRPGCHPASIRAWLRDRADAMAAALADDGQP